jgi:hypothetical protein
MVYTFLKFVDYQYSYIDGICADTGMDDRSMLNKSVRVEEIFLSILKNDYRIFAFKVDPFVKSVFLNS